MTRDKLFEIIRKKSSFLSIGLDTDISEIPAHLLKLDDPVFEFNKQIIDATYDLALAYKPNIAFYESRGPEGWQSLAKTMDYLSPLRKDLFLIADAKRGDIGNTSKQYARTFFEPEAAGLDFDAITAAPYMGSDSVEPFLEYKDKWTILLGLTSNKGAYDFQLKKLDREHNSKLLYEEVLEESKNWADADQMMYVVGATKAFRLNNIREILPDHFLLIPGIGAQGGSLEDVASYGMNKQCGLIVNASRSIIFASDGKDFAKAARKEALRL
ncbi:MAG: orotidine-5'-phosphate decarboxylase, partial [Bacteroidota bacterium]